MEVFVPDILQKKFSTGFDSYDIRKLVRGEIKSWLGPHDSYERTTIVDRWTTALLIPSYMDKKPVSFYTNVIKID